MSRVERIHQATQRIERMLKEIVNLPVEEQRQRLEPILMDNVGGITCSAERRQVDAVVRPTLSQTMRKPGCT